MPGAKAGRRGDGSRAEAPPPAVSRKLLAWYARARRDLPWRRSRDPYRVWLSEIMLQQTRVDAVIPYYERFLARFPTVERLAAAPMDDVLKAWEGLGYYSRARNLKAAAERVAAAGGRFPETVEALRELPGVGRYTAGAVASIAFGEAVPAVDGNVERVLSRLLAIEDDPARPAVKARFEGIARAMIPEGAASDFNQALMELGATVCSPTKPSCLMCPWRGDCAALRLSDPERFPRKAPKRRPREAVTLAAFAWDARGAVLLVREPGRGLLGGLWGFPKVEAAEADGSETLRAALRERYGLEVGDLAPRGEARHVFTHIRMTYRAFEGRARGRAPSDREGLRWTLPGALGEFALSKAMRKVAALLPEASA